MFVFLCQSFLAYPTINTSFAFCLYQAWGLSNYDLDSSPSGRRHFSLQERLSPLPCVLIRVGFLIFAVNFLCSTTGETVILKGPWRPFPVALLIYFCLDQMAPGSCDCTGVLLITLFISPTAQFKGQISCNTFARKINHSRSLLFGHHASDIWSVPHYTPKLLDLIHVFINSITKAGRVFVGLFANSSKCAANGMAGTTGLHRKEGIQVPAGSLTEAFLIFMEAAMKKMSRTFLMKPIKMQRKI